MSIRIDQTACKACGLCRAVCPGSLIKARPDGTAYLKRPEECWGCTACLKECRHGAIFYFLGADIGGRGSTMKTETEGPLRRWIIRRPDGESVTITVDRRDANKY
ncbi:MAG: ferredoxin family protein [Bacillota bacterium]|nr:ferredoxin family protein [Bacillota bacterium]